MSKISNLNLIGILRLLKKLGRMVIIGFPWLSKQLPQRILRFKDELFLTSYVIGDAKESGGLSGIFICRNKPDPQGHGMERGKTFLRNKLSYVFNHPPDGIDFVLVDARARYVRKYSRRFDNAKIIPKWVRQTNACFNGFSDFSQSRNRNAYCDIQAFKKYNYDYEFTKDVNLLSFFYEKMYCPYMHNRYPDEKVVLPFEAIKEEFENGGLLFVKEKTAGKYLSGSIVQVINGTFSPVKLGILNGDLQLLRKDVLTALYVAYFRFMEENKLSRGDFGNSRAFLNDGVLKYKEKWTTSIEFDQTQGSVFVFKACRFSESLNHFLLNNPFIAVEGEKLIGNIFLPPHTKVDEEALKKNYALKGLAGFRVCYPNPEQTPMEQAYFS